MLQITKFAYRKGLGTCDALLCVSNILQSALESGQEDMILAPPLIWSTIREFSMGTGGSVLSELTQFLSNSYSML